MKPLFNTLREYCESNAYPLHMPGHKRNRKLLADMFQGENWMPYDIDITEIDGFDNLHHAEGILKEAQERTAKLYGAQKSFFLINGSTCGLLAAVFASTIQGGSILMARNCHKAVYHAALLRELDCYYLYPTVCEDYQINGEIRPEDVEKEIKAHPEVTAVLLTSPSYDGMISDIKTIAEIVHKYGKILIVDEAHGAHFGFHEYFPENSLQKGADIVIHSLHKTLPSLTQTALLQLSMGSRADVEKIKKYLGIFETSSPSYVFMSGMEQCILYLEEKKEELFDAFVSRLEKFYEEAEKLNHIKIVYKKNQDHSKLVIFADALTGNELADILRNKYQLEVEMESREYVLALMSICDTDEGFIRLFRALREIDKETENKERRIRKGVDLSLSQERFCKISQVEEKEKRTVELARSAGHVSAEFAYLYPPGIPLIVPGEVINRKLVQSLGELLKEGFEIQGMQDYSGRTIQIIDIGQ